MNPSAIFLRDTKPAPLPARQPSAAKAPFSVPVEAGDGREPPRRASPGQRDDPGRAAGMRTREQRPARQDQDARGPDRDEPVRQDEKANRGEASGRRSARADDISNREKTKTLGTDKKTPGAEKKPPAAGDDAPVTPESAAMEALDAAQAANGSEILAVNAPEAALETAPDASAETGTTISPEAKAEAEAAALAAQLQPAGVISAELVAPAPPIAPQAGDEAAQNIGAPAISEGLGKPAVPVTSATLQGVMTGALTDGAGNADAVKADMPATSSDEANTETQTPESQQQEQKPAGKPGFSAEAKPEMTGAPQPASQRLDPLPPGLSALPENARALQAQAIDGKPGLGQQPHGPRASETPPTSLAALPIEIGFRALSGTKRFDIRLDPPELGRVDVSLSFDKEGEVTAKLTVERVETLHLLQRDARTLERAFDQAGLRTGDAGIQLSLSDRNAGQGGGFQSEEQRARGNAGRNEHETKPQITELMPTPRRMRLGGVDLNV